MNKLSNVKILVLEGTRENGICQVYADFNENESGTIFNFNSAEIDFTPEELEGLNSDETFNLLVEKNQAFKESQPKEE